jgi:site-specific DNA-cytosine methylase
VYLVGYSTTPGGDWRGVFPIGENVRENTAKRPVGYEIGDFRNDEGWRPRKDGIAPCLATRRHSETDVSNTPPLLKDVGTFRTDAGWQSSKDGNTPTLLARARDSYCSSQTLLKVKNETFDEIGDYRSDEGWRPRKDNNCPTLAARAREDGSGQPLLKVKSATSKEAVVEPIIGAIRGRNPENPNDNSKGIEYKQRFEYNKKGTANALTSDVTMNMVQETSYRIRRLTPIECERLQGFPDNHTEYGNYDGEVKKMSNTQRYKQCGNAVTVDIVALVAEAVKPLFK